MTAFLLDASALVALSWPTHPAHDTARRWFRQIGRERWASCPFTQCAFVRIVSNPAFSHDALPIAEAIDLLRTIIEHPRHEFWPDDREFGDLIGSFEDHIVGHQQVTDAYLLGLAMRRKGKLATLDRGLASLVPNEAKGVLEFIG